MAEDEFLVKMACVFLWNAEVWSSFLLDQNPSSSLLQNFEIIEFESCSINHSECMGMFCLSPRAYLWVRHHPLDVLLSKMVWVFDLEYRNSGVNTLKLSLIILRQLTSSPR